MLLLVTGGVGSGKSAYALQWAMSLGLEAIRLSCPPFPDMGLPGGFQASAVPSASGFALTELPAEETLAATLNLINRESNIFRADRRVLIVDSLSGWLRARAQEAKAAGVNPGSTDSRAEGTFKQVLDSILAFEGKRIVVTEEAAAGLAADPWERWFALELAAAMRLLAEESHAVYRLTAGIAAELKGHRVKRGRTSDEHLYPNRR